MRYRILGLLVLGLVLFSAQSLAKPQEDIQRLQDAVVKIHTTAAAPDYFTPWAQMNVKNSSGSGAVIRGNRILTNAHVVANARYIQAQKHGDPRKYVAEVSFVSHEADLAILTVEQDEFFQDLRPLVVGELPDPMEEVSVYGFPAGGNSLSITTGVMSRAEHQRYAHGGSFLLSGQIDAAINPGNSGGPVIVDRQIVGVVMQARLGSSSENQGYFVPPSVIEHVLKDSENGVHDGLPDLGFRSQNLESPAMKAAYGVEENGGGVLVTKIFQNTSAEGQLQVGDVLLEIDGHTIADDGSIAVKKDLRTDLKYAIDQHHVGDAVDLVIARDGKHRQVSITAGQRFDSYRLVRPEQFDQRPEYYIHGGVVFVPLNMNLIKRWGRDWRNAAPTDFLQARGRWTSPERRERVVALRVLASDVNLGYHDWKNWVVDSVNGAPIRDFDHFVRMIHDTEESHLVLEDDDGYQMVIDNEKARKAEDRILALYQVPRPHSVALLDNLELEAPEGVESTAEAQPVSQEPPADNDRS